MRRVTVAEIMRETGLSRATVDRVLNGRGRVHARTQQVIRETVSRLQSPPSAPAAAPVADLMLRVGRGMTRQMETLWQERAVAGQVHDVYEADEADVVRMIVALSDDVSRPLIITLKNTERIADALRSARSRGKCIVSLVSDVAVDSRDHYVGIDNRAAGQTAAYLIGRALGSRPSVAGVVVGDTAFRCHEDREIGFRTGLRAHFPKVVLAGEARGEDSAELTFRAVTKMLHDNPAMGAIYNVGGGNQGLTAALRDAGRTEDVVVVGHDVNFVTAPLLRDALMDCVIASDPAQLLDAALAIAAGPRGASTGSRPIDFGVYTRFNLPGFVQ